MNKVKVGFFSFTEITDAAGHRAYNEWHQLDHMPEQFPLPGVAHGQRWVATPQCQRARAVDEELLRPAHYMTLYLMADPVDRTLEDFMELGQRLHGLGRFYRHRRAQLSGPFQFLEAHAAPRVAISPEAVPYRPNLGVYVIVEEPIAGQNLDPYLRRLREDHLPEVLGLPGVAGAWSFATSPRLAGPGWSSGNRRITVCYLDEDPVSVAGALRPLLAERWNDAPVRPVFAGPLETITPWEWGWFDDEAKP
jgi:hypothetical protein